MLAGVAEATGAAAGVGVIISAEPVPGGAMVTWKVRVTAPSTTVHWVVIGVVKAEVTTVGVGAAEVLKRIRGYEERFGARWTPAPALVEMAASGKRFHG